MIFGSVVLVCLLYGSLLPFGGTIQAVAAFIAVPIVAWELLTALIHGRLHPVIPVVFVVFATLLIPAIFAAPMDDDYGNSKFNELATLSLFTAVVASIVRNSRYITVFAYVWIIFGIVIAAMAMSGASGIADRAVGIADSNPIGLARAISTAAIAVIWLLMQRRIHPAAGVGVAAVLVLGLFATGSKGPLLAAIVAVIAMALASSRQRLKRVVQISFGGLALYLAARFIPGLRETRLGEFIIDPGGVQDVIREALINASFDALDVTDGFAQGYGAWSHVTGFWLTNYPHNIWLELAIEAGMLTVIIIIGLVAWAIFRLFFSNDATAQIAMSWLVAEAVTSSLTGDARARTFWFFLVLGFLTLWMIQQQKRAEIHPASTTVPLARADWRELFKSLNSRGPQRKDRRPIIHRSTY